MIDIGADKYRAEKVVLFNGKNWRIRLPGARDELALSQIDRRMKHLEKRIESGTASDADLDKLDELEKKMYTVYLGFFQDETEDNSQVKAWLDDTPFGMVKVILEDITKQAEAKLDATDATEKENLSQG